MDNVPAHTPGHGLAVTHRRHLVITTCTTVGVCNVIGLLIDINNHCACQTLALLAQAVTSLEHMPKNCCITCCDALNNPQHANTIDKLRAVLVETTRNFHIYVACKSFKHLRFLATGLHRVNKFAAKAELLARGRGQTDRVLPYPLPTLPSPQDSSPGCAAYTNDKP